MYICMYIHHENRSLIQSLTRHNPIDPSDKVSNIYIRLSTQGKEVATQIKVLPAGSVQFDTVGEEVFQGAVRTPVIRSFTHGRGKELEPLSGELVYQQDADG